MTEGTATVPSVADERGVQVAFDRVSFQYPSRPPVLSGLDFTVAAGERVALVGSSGAGKSTVFKLISRLYDVSAGAVSVAGVDVSHYPYRDLRSRVSIIQQEPFLFAGTVLENVRLSLGPAPDDVRRTVAAALRSAGLDDLLRRLPNGLDSFVGEDGLQLSGGERQRIAIARNLIRPTPVVLLDEITSGVDKAMEASVLANLETHLRGRTVIAISHDPEVHAQLRITRTIRIE